MKFNRNNFAGGMNLQYEPTRLGDTEYPLLINGRNREGTIRPILSPALVPMAITGKYQGLYASNELLMLLVDGIPYVANLTVGTNFNRIYGVQMNPNVETVWATVVPKSTLNFSRIPSQKDAAGSTWLQTGIPQTAACAVLQDGLTRPGIVEADGLGRHAKDYVDWSVGNREYVPIGTNMLYADGTLYIVSSDGREIYRSIRGRPLDFMINIQPDSGDKLPLEQNGGASTVSHAVGYDTITCLSELNSPDNAFFVGTNRYSTKVTPNPSATIFGEPTFVNTVLMPTGPVNQWSFVESNGDNLLVNVRGIRSFNAALQMRNRGDNAPFSKRVNKLFRGIVQSASCCVKFDDYVLFSVQTVFGPAVLVYDETAQVFVGLDMYQGVGTIKQFARVTINNLDRLFFITTDNQLYEAFAGTTTETCQLFIGEFCSQDANVQIQPQWLKLVLVNPLATGTVSITPYVDRKPYVKLTKTVEQGIVETSPQAIPFTPSASTNGVQVLSWDLNRTGVGWKFGVLIELTGDAEISHLALNTSDTAPLNPAKSEAREWKARMP